MERSDKKHILLLITNPFAMINVIHSGLVRELGKHYSISIMSDLLTADDIERFNKYFQLNMRFSQTPIPEISSFARALRAVQTRLFGHHFILETIRLKLMERSPLLHRLFCISQKSPALIFLSGSLLGLIRNWLIRLTTWQDLGTSVAEYHFQAVISTSPLDLRENAVTNSLNPHGIPNISIIISWDNLTSKGVINSKSDLVLVWNKPMALEYARFYTVFGDNAPIRITGIQRFDTYFRERPNRGHILSDLPEVSPPTRIILFSTGAIKHHPCQNYIIDDLLEYVQSRPDMMILVRCHPGDDPKRYDRFSGIKNLRFFHPFGKNAGRIPPVDFLEILFSQLAGCAVCVQVASTMLLDALACNRPCISIAYDAHSGTHYARSVQRFYDYSHQRLLPDCLKEQIVYRRRELFDKLDEILMGGNLPNNLRNAVKPVVHRFTPDSVRSTTRYIREWLG